MDSVLWTTVEGFVSSHTCLLSFPLVATKSTVNTSLQGGNGPPHNKSDVRHNGVDNHSLEDLLSNIGVPFWRVVVIWTSEVLGDEVWAVLFQVGVNRNKEQTGVKELGNENSIGDHGKLSTMSIFGNPYNEFDNNSLEDNVNNNDNDGNG